MSDSDSEVGEVGESGYRHINDLPKFVTGLSEDDPSVRLKNVISIRSLLSVVNSPPIQQVIDSGCVPLLVSFLDRFHDEPALVFETCWALTNLLSGNSEQTAYVLEQGAVPIFVELCSSDCNMDIKRQVCWALGNIAGDSVSARDHVLAEGGCEGLVKGLDVAGPSSTELKMKILWVLSNLMRGKPSPPLSLVRLCLPSIARELFLIDLKVESADDILWALAYISDGTNASIQAVLDTGCIPKLVEILGSSLGRDRIPALRTIGNITTGMDAHVDVIIQSGALPTMKMLLQDNSKQIRKETCWSLSNITAGSPSHIQAVIDADIFPTIFTLIRTDQYMVRKEASWVLSNSMSGSTLAQLHTFVNMDTIPVIVDMLRAFGDDRQLLTIALEAVESLLRGGTEGIFESPFVAQFLGNDLLAVFEDLQDIPDEILRNKIEMITNTYFALTEGEATPVGTTNKRLP